MFELVATKASNKVGHFIPGAHFANTERLNEMGAYDDVLQIPLLSSSGLGGPASLVGRETAS